VRYSTQVPVVDLAEPDEVAAQKMRAACEDFGFLYGEAVGFCDGQ
jgi:hypothetical protein